MSAIRTGQGETAIPELRNVGLAGVPEPTISRVQVAVALGVTPDTVSRMSKHGRLRGHRVGRRLRFFWSEVLAQLERNRTGGAQ